ncbi:MAG: hypothetical protein J1F31_02585 [Erysipelotrichales bacterium]|nr:hypothetical protein [Erysipelotrichales bacterium]
MKKNIIFSAFILLAGLVALNSCGGSGSMSNSMSVGGVLQDSNNSEFNPFEPPVSDSSDSTSELPPDEGKLPNEIVGLWIGYDDLYSFTEFTFEVFKDGSAVFKDENGEMELYFTYDEDNSIIENSDYFFKYNENPEVVINIWINNSSYVQFSVEDEAGVINDIDHFYFYSYVEIEKALYK